MIERFVDKIEQAKTLLGTHLGDGKPGEARRRVVESPDVSVAMETNEGGGDVTLIDLKGSLPKGKYYHLLAKLCEHFKRAPAVFYSDESFHGVLYRWRLASQTTVNVMAIGVHASKLTVLIELTRGHPGSDAYEHRVKGNHQGESNGKVAHSAG